MDADADSYLERDGVVDLVKKSSTQNSAQSNQTSTTIEGHGKDESNNANLCYRSTKHKHILQHKSNKKEVQSQGWPSHNFGNFPSFPYREIQQEAEARTAQGHVQLTNIEKPHKHDVLCGRGNFVNYHAGNRQYRSLVKKHFLQYIASPKPDKPKYALLIYHEIRMCDPPGRFLRQDPETKLWHDVGEKKALDKTRQALREGAPEAKNNVRYDSTSNEAGSQEKRYHSREEGDQQPSSKKSCKRTICPDHVGSSGIAPQNNSRSKIDISNAHQYQEDNRSSFQPSQVQQQQSPSFNSLQEQNERSDHAVSNFAPRISGSHKDSNENTIENPARVPTVTVDEGQTRIISLAKVAASKPSTENAQADSESLANLIATQFLKSKGAASLVASKIITAMDLGENENQSKGKGVQNQKRVPTNDIANGSTKRLKANNFFHQLSAVKDSVGAAAILSMYDNNKSDKDACNDENPISTGDHVSKPQTTTTPSFHCNPRRAILNLPSKGKFMQCDTCLGAGVLPLPSIHHRPKDLFPTSPPSSLGSDTVKSASSAQLRYPSLKIPQRRSYANNAASTVTLPSSKDWTERIRHAEKKWDILHDESKNFPQRIEAIEKKAIEYRAYLQNANGVLQHGKDTREDKVSLEQVKEAEKKWGSSYVDGYDLTERAETLEQTALTYDKRLRRSL